MNRAMERLRLDRRRLIGIGLAIAAAALALAATRPPETVDVVVAARDLAAATPIPPDAVEHRAVIDPTGLVMADVNLDGLVLRSPVSAGEPLLPSMLVDSVTPDPPVALGLELPAASGVLGRLVPGDRVDVHVTDHEAQTEAVARNVRVLEVDESEGLGADRFVRVLLGTNRTTAARIAGAGHRGDVDLVRVNR